MLALYNEIEPYAATWIENLVAAGHVAPGCVERRSIADLTADDVRGYRQAHFFAGIAGWSYALRLAGWPDDVPVWTGSCPCQPFSAAGRRGGFDDARHLWPTWFKLIAECRPPIVFGEQVASPDGLKWLDFVHADLEGAGYSVGVADLCAAGVGAPHIRQRLYFVAVAPGERLEGLRVQLRERRSLAAVSEARGRGETRLVADPGRKGRRQVGEDAGGSEGRGRAQGMEQRSLHGGALGGTLADTERERWERGKGAEGGRVADGQAAQRGQGADGSVGLHKAGPILVADSSGARLEGHAGDVDGTARRAPSTGSVATSDATRGAWGGPDWLACRDGKWRPVEPGTFPLAHGVPARVGKLRGYGNAIVPQVAATFIQAVMHTLLD